MSPDQQQIIAGWLRQTDIARLELTGPQAHLRIENEAAGFIPSPARRVITSRHAGVFLLAHPLRREALVTVGAVVKTGAVLALLKSGPLLLPVTAPCDGRLSACFSTNQSLVGYGTPLFELQC